MTIKITPRSDVDKR